jgi:hypothetical protein
MVSFKATSGRGGVLLEWRTGFELDNLGFNLYRERQGDRTLVNPSLIAGSLLSAGQGVALTAGRPYIWRDPQGTPDSLYYLESVDLNGQTRWHGPFMPVPGSTGSKGPQDLRLPDALSASGGSDSAGQVLQTEGPASATSGPPAETASGSLEDQWAIANQPATKIQVRKDGWYRVTQPELVAAGYDPAADASNLRLFVDGVEQPMLVRSGSNGRLGASDYIEFYGTKLDTPTTDIHVYWLVPGTTLGKRIPVIGEQRPDSVENPPALPNPGRTRVSEPGQSILWGVFAPFIIWRNSEPHIEPTPDNSPKRSKDETEEKKEAAENKEAVEKREAENREAAPAVEPAQPLAQGQPSAEQEQTVQPEQSATASAQKEKAKQKASKRRSKARRLKNTSKRLMNHASPAGGSLAQSYSYAVEYKARGTYTSALINGDKENFFGPVIATQPVPLPLNLSNIDTSAQGPAFLEVALQGASLVIHNVHVLVNGVEVGLVNFAYRENRVQSFPLSLSALRDNNTVTFTTNGVSGDVSLVDYLRIVYPRTYRAENNYLRFSLRSNQSARVDGFTTPNVRLVDISDPRAIQEFRPAVEQSGQGYAIIVGTGQVGAKGRRTLIAFSDDKFEQSAGLTPNQPSSLNQTGQSADMVVIAHRNFMQSVTPLVNLRSGSPDNLTVKVIDVEDIFDEFGYGTPHDPWAIRDFLKATTERWTKAPRYVLLVGDASYDSRGYYGTNFDYVPSKMMDATYSEAASDDWLADFNGDSVPEMAVGRLPVRTAAELDIIISKIVGYSQGAVQQKALFVADNTFESENAEISALLPGSITVQNVNLGPDPSQLNNVRTQLFNGINQGPMIVNYAGHGTVDAWTGMGLFKSSDVPQYLNNGNHLPLFVMMTCLTGYYNDPVLESISETLMKSPNGGSVAIWASSGLTVPFGQQLMNRQLYQLLFSSQPPTLGEAVRQSKAATSDTDVRTTWILFGDPAMRVR